MEKKNLKWYDAPKMEIVEMETEVVILADSQGIIEDEGDNEH